ncbi:MAG: hypothetical protein OXB86_05685, partial [Bdellovibrionales bacterium]|nr:hypothetical protein [Bdellovibrionales bacterium]
LFIFPVFADQSDKFELCYFAMSGVPDSAFLEENLRKNYGVKEDQMPLHIHATKKGENINEVFKKWLDNMVTKNQDNCDGLIYSGYYTGGHFHQEKGDTKADKNKLDLSFVEKLSCDPKYKSWFENVKQVWLFGSFTVTDTIVKNPSSKTGNRLATPVTKPDDDFSMGKLNLSFAHAMDRGTPLSSRWMRAFPNTNLYGWSDEAPTSHQIKRTWKGTHPVFEHIKQIGQTVKAQTKEKEDKKSKAIDKQTILKGVQVLSQGNFCDEPWENIVTDGRGVEGVRQNKYGKTKKLGCDLINAQQIMDLVKMDKYPDSLETSTWCDNTFAKDDSKRQDCLNNPGKFLKTATQKLCENLHSQEKNKCIKNPKLFSKNKILDTLKQINETETQLTEARKTLNSEKATQSQINQARTTIQEIIGEAHITDDAITVSHLLFNEIDSSYLTARNTLNRNDTFFKDIKSVLSLKSPTIRALKEKVKSPTLSTTRKVDYIEFYKSLHQNEGKFVSNSVQDIIDAELKCTYWKPKKNGSCPKKPVVGKNSHIGKGRGADRITPQHHYTLTAVVSDQLRQYDLLTPDQIQTLQKTLQKVPEKETNNYIMRITKCLSAESTNQFNNCKQSSI